MDLAKYAPHSQWVLATSGLLLAISLMLFVRLLAPRRVALRSAVALTITYGLLFLTRELLAWSAARPALTAATTLCFSLAMARLLFLLTFDVVLDRGFGEQPPKIVRDLTQGGALMMAGVLALRSAGVDTGQLLTTSALLTVGAGLALQETLGNLLAGLAIRGDRPFEVGDWIEVHPVAGQNGTIGKVKEINWRATRVTTLDNIDVMFPNGVLGKAAISNYDRPHGAARRSVYFYVPLSVPPRRVHEVVLPAIKEAPGVLATPAPSLVTFGFAESGVQFWLRYFIRDMGRRDAIDGAVRDRVWYALARAGLELSVPSRVVHLHEVNPATEAEKASRRVESRLLSLRRIDLLSGLPDVELQALAARVRLELYAPEEPVIRKGEPGDSMFVIERGELSVRVDDSTHEVAVLPPGAFFGEMSLLTGQPRTATIVAKSSCELLVIDHRCFGEILATHPEIAQAISTKVAERQTANALPDREKTELALEIHQSSSDLLAKIRSFFRLGKSSGS
jgi:small-conductance mechanosensitive channel/CRP-like cAMP-binding protein